MITFHDNRWSKNKIIEWFEWIMINIQHCLTGILNIIMFVKNTVIAIPRMQRRKLASKYKLKK